MGAHPAWERLLGERTLLARVVALARNSIPLLHVSRRLRSAILDADLGERALRSDDPYGEIDCLSLIALAARTSAALRVELNADLHASELIVAGWHVESLPSEVHAAFRVLLPRTIVAIDVRDGAADLSGALAPWLGRPRRFELGPVTPELRALLCSALAAGAEGVQSITLLDTTEHELLVACRTARFVEVNGRPQGAFDSTLARALSCCTNITDLMLHRFLDVDGEAMQTLAHALGTRTHPLRLKLGFMPGSALALFSERALCARLERVAIKHSTALPAGWLEPVCEALAQDAKRLRSLCLMNHIVQQRSTIAALSASGVLDLPLLSKVDLTPTYRSCTTESEGFEKLSRLTALRLTWLDDLNRGSELVHAIARGIAASRTLQELVVVDSDVTGGAAASLLRALPTSARRLSISRVRRAHFLGQDELVEVLYRLRRLRTCDIAPEKGNKKRTAREDELMRYVLDEFPHITELGLILAPE